MSTKPTLTYEAARDIYRRLCERSARIFNSDTAEAHALASVVNAMCSEWDFSQGFMVSDLKHLPAGDRSDVLLLVEYIVAGQYFPAGFGEINREAHAHL